VEVPLPLHRLAATATSEADRLLVDAIAAGSRVMGVATYLSSFSKAATKLPV